MQRTVTIGNPIGVFHTPYLMTAKQPIDYARAESADVVRKKHRRRVVWFVVATVVVIAIGIVWVHSLPGRQWSIGNNLDPVSVYSWNRWVMLKGPMRADPSGTIVMGSVSGISAKPYFRFGNRTIGFEVRAWQVPGYLKWLVSIRYRTLFTLAMIPWIITLIRLIRSWNRKPAADLKF